MSRQACLLLYSFYKPSCFCKSASQSINQSIHHAFTTGIGEKEKKDAGIPKK